MLCDAAGTCIFYAFLSLSPFFCACFRTTDSSNLFYLMNFAKLSENFGIFYSKDIFLLYCFMY